MRAPSGPPARSTVRIPQISNERGKAAFAARLATPAMTVGITAVGRGHEGRIVGSASLRRRRRDVEAGGSDGGDHHRADGGVIEAGGGKPGHPLSSLDSRLPARIARIGATGRYAAADLGELGRLDVKVGRAQRGARALQRSGEQSEPTGQQRGRGRLRRRLSS